jgi:hypothetical protein
MQHWAILTVIISLSALLSVTAVYERGYSIEKYDKSPGIYYESKGVAVLYNVKWRTVVYVNLNKIDNETLMLKQYVHHVKGCVRQLLSGTGQVVFISVAILGYG